MNTRIAVASLLETIKVNEAEKESLLAALTEAPTRVPTKLAVKKQPAMSQQPFVHKWGSPELGSLDCQSGDQENDGDNHPSSGRGSHASSPRC